MPVSNLPKIVKESAGWTGESRTDSVAERAGAPEEPELGGSGNLSATAEDVSARDLASGSSERILEQNRGIEDNHSKRIMEGSLDPDTFKSRATRREERKQRHKTCFFIPMHCKETRCVRREWLPQRYVSVPDWFSLIEVHHGLAVETPPLVTYKSSGLMKNTDSPLWGVLRWERVAFVARELMYEGRWGVLHFICLALREMIRDFGTSSLRANRNDARDLEALLDEIMLINWSRVLAERRHLLGLSGNRTPVYERGDWVPFDTSAWRSTLSADDYLAPLFSDMDLSGISPVEWTPVYASTTGWSQDAGTLQRESSMQGVARDPEVDGHSMSSAAHESGTHVGARTTSFECPLRSEAWERYWLANSG